MTTSTARATEALAFLETLYGDAERGQLAIWTDDLHTRWFSVDNLTEAARAVTGLATFHNAYFGIGLHDTAPAAGRGKAGDVIAIPGVWAELDIAGPGHTETALPTTLTAALSVLDAIPLPPTMIVSSGGGLHLWWLFKEIWYFEDDDERRAAASLVERVQAVLIAAALKRGWVIDPVADLARVLRPPGTINHKLADLKRPVRVIRVNDATRYNPDDFTPFLPDEETLGWVTPETPVDERSFPPADLGAILQGCAWLRSTRERAASLREPEWYAQLSIVGRCADGVRLAHEISSPHPGYAADETDLKLQRALSASGPRTCLYMHNKLGAAELCDACQHWGKIKTPVVLGRKYARLHFDNGAKGDAGDTAGHASYTNGASEPPQPPSDADDDSPSDDASRVALADFRAYLPEHKYIFLPSRQLWPSPSVNARVGRIPSDGGSGTVLASAWLDEHQPVEQMTWAPGEPTLIEGRLISDGGWIYRPDFTCFNLYRPPSIELGDPDQAGNWINHVHWLYPTEAEHIITWLAHRVQRPGVKINHALVLGGQQGIGKDTILEPVKHAIGPWNIQDISPVQLLGRFNGFVKSVILRISEARDLGDVDRYAFYEHLKVYTASPPDVLRCDEKNIREYSILNVCGVIITSNHRTDGIYLPSDDRRHFVAWSDVTESDLDEDYFSTLYRWFDAGGFQHIAAYLNTLDISDFNPKAPPPKTAAFWDIVDAGRSTEDADMADALDALGRPTATTIAAVLSRASTELAAQLNDHKYRRQVPHRMESAGYVKVRNPADTNDGLWKINGRRQAVYARRDLAERDRIDAAQALTRRSYE